MSDQFTTALDDAEAAHTRDAEQLDLAEGRTPFAAESLSDARVPFSTMRNFSKRLPRAL